ncbi:MAG TPA: ADOP family duplicated permease [Vicinamibacterales bacterium]|nr:ADOP family duplicated permease [Vicinamibacterales bacterium]
MALRGAVRALWARPQLSLMAVALLALGTGANTILFALADAVMFRPFPFAGQDRLVIGGGVQAGHRSEIPYPDFVDWRTRAHSFDDLAAIASWNWTGTLQADEPAPLEYRAVSGNFFDVLGAAAALGRTLTAADDRRGAALAIVLSHGFWQRQFGGDRRVIGRSVRLGRRLYTIVGIMPPAFSYPERPDAWVAIVPAVERFPVPGQPDFVDDRDVSVLLVIGRLKPDVRIETARLEVDRIVRDLAAAYGRTGRMASTLAPLVDDVIGSARIRLWALLAAVALLLTAAAANVAGLFLVHMSARRREFAIRMALGASTGAIARELLCEAALVTALASGLAFAIARTALPLLLAVVPQDLPRVEQAVIGVRALVYTAGVGTFVTAVCVLVPLLTVRGSRLEQILRDGGRTATGNRHNRRARRLLVVAEIAIAVLVLSGAALLYRSVASLAHLDVGFVADRLVAIEVHAPSVQTADRTREHQFYTRLIDALRTLPSVESAAGVAGRPLKRPTGLDSSWQRDGQTIEEAKRNPWANLETVTPGYFETMGIRLLEGRRFTDDDRMETAPVTVVGETFARRTWPGTSAIGKRLRGHGFDEKRRVPPWWTVVGVVADVRYRDLRAPSLDLYVPYDQAEFSIGDVVIRARGPAQAAVAAIHARVRSVDPDGAIRIALMPDEIAREQMPWRANLLFFAFFAALTAFIALVGLYGLLASLVAEQAHEFGVRLALGATTGRVISEVLAAAGRTAFVGVGLGCIGAAAAGRGVQAMLFGVSPLDAVALTTAPVVILILGVTASVIPARRAARIDPIVSLRAE